MPGPFSGFTRSNQYQPRPVMPKDSSASSLPTPPPLPNESVLLTYPETARALTISRRTLERMVSGGTFPQPLRVGGSSRFHRDDVANYLEQLRRARGEKLGTS